MSLFDPNAQEMLDLMYDNEGYFHYAMSLHRFLMDSEEDEMEKFLQTLRPGSVRDTRGLLVLWGVLQPMYLDHSIFSEIEGVIRSRIPLDPLRAAYLTFKETI